MGLCQALGGFSRGSPVASIMCRPGPPWSGQKERGLAASFLFLPVGLADLVIEANARTETRMRQQAMSQAPEKRPHPEGAASLTGRKCPEPEDIRPRASIQTGTERLTLYGQAVTISGRGL